MRRHWVAVLLLALTLGGYASCCCAAESPRQVYEQIASLLDRKLWSQATAECAKYIRFDLNSVDLRRTSELAGVFGANWREDSNIRDFFSKGSSNEDYSVWRYMKLALVHRKLKQDCLSDGQFGTMGSAIYGFSESDISRALGYAAEAIAEGADPVEIQYEVARVRAVQSRLRDYGSSRNLFYSEAVNGLRQYLGAHPKSREAWDELVDLTMTVAPKEAAPVVEEALAVFRDDPDYMLRRAVMAWLSGQPETAEKWCQRILQLDPSVEGYEVVNARAHVLMTMKASTSGDKLSTDALRSKTARLYRKLSFGRVSGDGFWRYWDIQVPYSMFDL